MCIHTYTYVYIYIYVDLLIWGFDYKFTNCNFRKTFVCVSNICLARGGGVKINMMMIMIIIDTIMISLLSIIILAIFYPPLK